MNTIYKVFEISKQSFHQRVDRQLVALQEGEHLLVLIRKIREDHPRMSSRQMYRLIKPVHFGRDKFEAFCFQNGFKVSIKRAFHRTTNSFGVKRFPNLLDGFELKGINRVWVSDITYFRIGDRFYYLTFILDLFSRVIVGHSVSINLLTSSTTLPALRLALTDRKIEPGLIFHSDGGGQYYSKDWLELTSHYKIKNSMCKEVYENSHAERINGIIKNDYLAGYGPQDLEQLIWMTRKAVLKYNSEKPHGNIGNICPTEFENKLKAA